MSKHNRSNNPTFRPNQHLFQKDNHKHLSVPEQNNQDRELLRAIFRDEITDNDVLAAFDRIDSNKDGRVSKAEFDAFQPMRGHGKHAGPRQPKG